MHINICASASLCVCKCTYIRRYYVLTDKKYLLYYIQTKTKNNNKKREENNIATSVIFTYIYIYTYIIYSIYTKFVCMYKIS